MTNELIIIEKKEITELFRNKDGLNELLDKIEKEALSFVPNISTESGRKELKSLAFKVARTKTAIDELGKNLVQKAKQEIKTVDSARKHARDFLDDLKAKVRKPLTDWETAEQVRIETHKKNLAHITGLGFGFNKETGSELNSDELKSNLRTLETVKISQEVWQEFTLEAERAKEYAIKQLKILIAEKTAQEAEAERIAQERREAEKKAQAEYEKRIADEARIKAEREAERKIREAEARAEMEKQERIAAEARAKARIERERQENLRRIEAEKREQERIAAERAADKEYRRKINQETLSDLIDNFIDETTAKKIITLAASGRIRNLKIEY